MKNKKAVFTIVKNEKLFLPIWLNYYSKHFNIEDVYILDHQSNDGSTSNLPCNVRVVVNELAFDHNWIVNTVMSFQRELLEKYDVVLFVEVDEIVFNKEGLDNYIDGGGLRDREFVRCNGYDLIHMPQEPEYVPGLPILQQRSYWFQNHTFQAKPYLSRIPLNWDYGYHACKEGGEIDPELYLIHLNRFDYNKALERNLERQQFKFHEGDKAAGFGFQKSLQGEAFRDWFYNFTQNSPIIEIPQWVKELNLV